MQRGTTKKKRRVRFPGICADALTLGVHRSSLYLALAKKRPGRSLTQRYHALKEQQATTTEKKNMNETCRRAEEARTEARHATVAAYRSGASADHHIAMQKHDAAATAARSAATSLSVGGDEAGAEEYRKRAVQHDNQKQMHRDEAAATLNLEQPLHRQGAAGVPGSEIRAQALGLLADSPGRFTSTAQAMDAYLHTRHGNEAYQTYREAVIAGHPALPNARAYRSAR
jgi:hypothetical protein